MKLEASPTSLGAAELSLLLLLFSPPLLVSSSAMISSPPSFSYPSSSFSRSSSGRHLSSEECFTVNLLDSYGDGWQGDAFLSFTSVATADVFVGGLKLWANDFASAEEVCFPCGCFFGQATPGEFPSENSWNVVAASPSDPIVFLATAEGDARSEIFCPQSESCASCPAGSVSNGMGTACVQCPAGRYNDAEEATIPTCTPCGAGRYNEDVGSSSDAACKSCASGFYSPPGAPSCEPCEAGKYGAVVPVESCTDCSAGTYNEDTGSTSEAACKSCEGPGTYLVPPGASSCRCEAGKYGGVVPVEFCTDCSAGTYNEDVGSSSDAACKSCASGFYSPPGAPSCEPCEAGKYGAVVPVESCTDCSAGTYNEDTGSTSEASCVVCASGFYSASGAPSCVMGTGEDDIEVLVSISDALGFNVWGFSVNGDATMSDACTSMTVLCDDDYSMVIGIQIEEHNELQGVPLSVFASLSELVNLESISLTGSGLTGPLPGLWARLRNLKLLDLSNNAISGPLPSEWAQLTNLQVLDLSINALSGPLPGDFASLSNLLTLNLNKNFLTGQLPPSWASMRSLETLELSYNDLFGKLPPEWGTMNLFGVYINNNAISGQLPKDWADMPSLTYLYLSHNDISGELPASWASLTFLEICLLRNNFLTSKIPPEWGRLTSLEYLDISRNALFGDLPAGFSELANLRILDLSYNALSEQLPPSWINNFNLRWLYLSNNEISGVLPSAWQVSNFRVLDLSSNALVGQLPLEWAGMPSIQRLDISNNALVGPLPISWASLAQLTWLDLSENALTGPLPPVWSNLHLSWLYLGSNALTGPLPKGWATMTSLQALDLSNNSFGSQIPSEWGSMTSIESIDLSSNALTGPLPTGWATMTSLQSLDLSNNALSGQLSEDLTRMSSLEVLRISNNSVSGQVLSDMSNLKNLVLVDFSLNDLSGALPMELSNLPSLRTFNISSNAITGGLEHPLSCAKLQSLDASENMLTGSLSFIRDIGVDSVTFLVLSRNSFDSVISPSDFALSSESRTSPLVVDLRENDFSCPFPTADTIREASNGMTSVTLVLNDPCNSNYGSFLLDYCLPVLGGLVGAFVLIKVGIYLHLQVAVKLTQPMKKDVDDQVTLTSHKRLKFIRLGLLSFVFYDIINDISLYAAMIDTIDNAVFPNPCSIPNQRDSFYPNHVAHIYSWDIKFTAGKKFRYPDIAVYDWLWDFSETGFTDFTQYSYYTSEEVASNILEGAVLITASERDDNIIAFSSFCEEFYKVDSIRECAYSNATISTYVPKVGLGASCIKDEGSVGDSCRVEGIEGCVRFRDVQREKNTRFKKFVVASIALVCAKELFKLILVLFIWLRAPSDRLSSIKVGLIGESPFCLLLVWRRPQFVQELLLTNSTRTSLLLTFFVEEVLESANQIFLVVYFALHIDQKGIEYGVMFSLAASVAKMSKTGYNLLMAWKRSIVAKVYAENLQKLHKKHKSWDVLAISGRSFGRRRNVDDEPHEEVAESSRGITTGRFFLRGRREGSS